MKICLLVIKSWWKSVLSFYQVFISVQEKLWNSDLIIIISIFDTLGVEKGCSMLSLLQKGKWWKFKEVIVVLVEGIRIFYKMTRFPPQTGTNRKFISLIFILLVSKVNNLKPTQYSVLLHTPHSLLYKIFHIDHIHCYTK